MVSNDKYRTLALALPDAVEKEHWGRPSFRVGNKIFGTMWPDERRAVLKLPLADQHALVEMAPDTYSAGPWGHQGWTFVELKRVRVAEFADLVQLAWRQVATKRALARL